MANPWEIQWAQPQGDLVIAPPDPYKQRADQRADRSLAIQEGNSALTQQLTELKIGEARDKADERAKDAEKSKRSEDAALYKMLDVIKAINDVGIDANDQTAWPGWGETGTSGNFMRNVPLVNNAGKDLAGKVDTIKANLAFDALAAMREASKTGGALGSITERELKLLESAVANLDPERSHDMFNSNLERVRQVYLAKLAMLSPELATRLGYNGEKAEAAVVDLNTEYEKAMGLQPQDLLVSRTATGSEKPPADIEAIMAKYGAR